MKAGLPLRIVQLVLLVAMARHLWLALYIHPYADDFSYAVVGMATPLGERLVQEYTSWNGRYFSNILVLCDPLVLGITTGLPLYRSAAIILILITWFAASHFLRVLLPGLSRVQATTAALAFVLLQLHVMPDASEGYYWYTGAVTYQLANVLSLFLAAGWSRAFRTASQPSLAWYARQSLLIIAIAGSNEVHMAFLVLGHAALLTWHRGSIQNVRRAMVVLFLVSVLCGLVVALAPGNATREALFPLRHDPVRTIAYSFAQTARFSLIWIFALLLPSLVFIGLLRRGIGQGVIKPFSAPLNKWVVLALPFTCVFVSMVVTYWPTGLLGQHRTLNMALFYFMPTWFFALAVWDQGFFRERGWRLRKMGASVFFWAVAAVCTTFLWKGRDGRVTDDLFSGRMARYDAGMQMRYRILAFSGRAGNKDEITFAPIELPKSLAIVPLDTSATHWMNRSYAGYFGVPGVRISSAPLPDPVE